MPVSLYDTMRPVAIAAGLGIGVGGEHGASLLSSGLGGIAFGILGFVVLGRVAKLWFARLTARSSQVEAGGRTSASEAPFAAAYISVFFALLLITIAGSHIGRWVPNEIRF
jgi:hypothetical protein